MPELSSFNHFYKCQEGSYLAYSAQSGAMAKMTSDNYATYQKLARKLESNSTEAFNSDEQLLLRQLEYGQFVVEDMDSEYEWLKFSHRQTRFGTSSLGLVIAPTKDCNMACKYCLEGVKLGSMSATLVESIITFIENRAPGLKDMQITWYGGEPLLAMDIIQDLTESILDLARQYQFKYAGNMISNGYLLTKETTDRLVDLQISHIQVTIDGPSRIHNAKRPLKDGAATFDTILSNLAYACTRIPVSVKVVIDNSFTPEIIIELLGELKAAGLQDKVCVFLGLVNPSTKACANIIGSCYGTRDFSALELEYYKLLVDDGFAIDKLPSPLLTFCFAQLSNSFLVDSDGELYRCFNYAGDKTKSMGNIRRDINYRHPEFIKLFQFDPFENTDCRACNILPICVGGCPAKRLDRNLPRNQWCDSLKCNLQGMLELIARSRQQQRQRPKAIRTGPEMT